MAEWLVGHTWPGFAQRYGDRLGADDLALGRTIVEHYRALHGEIVDWAERHRGWVVTHGDFRLDNMLFGDGTTAPHVTVVDWQTTTVGIGPVDVAYFCGTGLLPDERATHERPLVARYAAGLRAAGASTVLLAGRPRDLDVDDSCAVGLDAVAFLHRVRKAL